MALSMVQALLCAHLVQARYITGSPGKLVSDKGMSWNAWLAKVSRASLSAAFGFDEVSSGKERAAVDYFLGKFGYESGVGLISSSFSLATDDKPISREELKRTRDA